MNSRWMLCFPITCLLVAVSQAEEKAAKLSQHEIAARDFSYEKTKLGSTLKDFKKKYRKAEEIPDVGKKFENVYTDGKEDGLMAGYYFFEDRLLRMRIGYSQSDVRKIGGVEILVDQLRQKFGEPTEADNGEAMWKFEKVDRAIFLQIGKDKSATLMAVDTKLMEKLAEKTANNPGKLGID